MSLKGRFPNRSLRFLFIVLFSVICLPNVVPAQDAVCQTPESQSPTAIPGGPYVTSTAQAIFFNGAGSWSFEGPIIYYYWDFGDGTYATGPNPNHHYSVEGAYTVTLTVCDDLWNCASAQSFATAGAVNVPARIQFDELANNLIVADQYFNQFGVRFYSGNPSFPLHTSQTCGTCSTTSLPNFITTKPNDSGIVNVEFAQPVNNLPFHMIGVDVFFDPFAVIDVYRGGSLYASYPVFGNGTRTVGFTFGSLDNISKVVIRSITDPFGIGFDDFTFNVPSDIKITSARVSGYLNGTIQNALLGGDIALQATPLPGGFAGGTYSWSFTGPIQTLTGTSSSSVTFRSTALSSDVGAGPITATVAYTKNGLTATASVTINSVLPTLTSFTAQQGNSQVIPPGACGGAPLWLYKLGCLETSPPSDRGIHFTASVHANTFISNPVQSGIKYVQAVSAFRRHMSVGLRCWTNRSQESDVDSGWQLDTMDPYPLSEYPPRRFSEGNDLTMLTVDYPGDFLTGFQSWQFKDSFYGDDQFWMYVVYFAGDNPASPFRQRPIGRLRWNWGGLVVFDPDGTQFRHRIRFANVGVTVRTGEATSSMVTIQGVRTSQTPDVACPGGPPLAANHVDSTRVLVREYYAKILGRPADTGGWDAWTSYIAQCVFDQSCFVSRRSSVALGFFWSPEFTLAIAQQDPVMAHPPGSPEFNAAEYNRRFVYWCYKLLLGREPDPGGWDGWTNYLNSTGDYATVAHGFIYSTEYRALLHF